MIDERFEELLLGLIRTGMGISGTLPPIQQEDVARLEELGTRQGILPILWEGLKQQQLPKEWVRSLDRRRLRSIYRYYMRTDVLEQTSEAFRQSGIQYLPLKGAVLQSLYPEPWMRTSSDLDILVHEEDLARAISCLEEHTELRLDKRNYHDVTMLGKQICLELHFSVKENMEQLDKLLSRVWEFSKPTEDGCCCVLTPEFQVFHVLAHMSYHMVHGGLGIRPFLDLWLLREKTDYDETALRDMCSVCGILQFYEVACELLNVWMNGANHSETTRVLQQFCLSGSVFGSSASGARQREHQGISYVLHRWFVSRNVLEEMYPKLKSRPYLLPVYQVKRWLRLLDPRKRKKAAAEVARLNTISKESIRSFDALLNSLGL